MQILQLDERLVLAIVRATRESLNMAGLKPNPTGVSRTISTRRGVSALIGFVGAMSGSLMLNCTDETACFMAGRMLQQEAKEVTHETLDSMGEVVNMIAGQVKSQLSTTELRFDRISVPSVVIGSSYFITHYRGMTTLSVEFELPEMTLGPRQDPFFSVSLCMMKV